VGGHFVHLVEQAGDDLFFGTIESGQVAGFKPGDDGSGG
jgi:hypothetical protein